MSGPSDKEKELTKLSASWFNTLGAGAIAVGVFTPMSKLADPSAADAADWNFIGSSVAYLFFGVALHIVGRVLTDRRFDYDTP